MNILLLDDNMMSALRIENNLRAAGHAVVTARRAPETGVCDWVVFNLGSRSLDGLSQIAALRARCVGAPIWAFCGHREVELWRQARAAGVDKILTNETAMSQIAREIETASEATSED